MQFCSDHRLFLGSLRACLSQDQIRRALVRQISTRVEWPGYKKREVTQACSASEPVATIPMTSSSQV